MPGVMFELLLAREVALLDGLKCLHYSKLVNDFQLKLEVYRGPVTILTVRDGRWIHLPPRS
jgi:hypothetical protein